MAKFWTEKEAVPYQKHNFEVDIDLYYIRSAFYRKLRTGQLSKEERDAIVAAKINPSARSSKRYIAKIPSGYGLNKAIKSIDMPSVGLTIANMGSNSNPSYEAQDPEFRNLSLVFYGTPNVVKYIPQIFYAYWITDQGQLANLINKSTNTVKPENILKNTSAVNLTLFNNVEGEKRRVNYTKMFPSSFDLGELEYGVSDVLEVRLQMMFNMPDTTRTNSLRLAGPGVKTKPKNPNEKKKEIPGVDTDDVDISNFLDRGSTGQP
jgi:hypothetical protein